MLAAQAPSLVGYASGFPIARDGSWWNGFRGPLPQDVEQLTTSGRAFAISWIVVRPPERNHGLADRLHELLLADHPALLATTLVDRTHRAACAGFRSRGWHDIGLLYRPPGPTVLRALVLPLGERTTVEPGGLLLLGIRAVEPLDELVHSADLGHPVMQGFLVMAGQEPADRDRRPAAAGPGRVGESK
ncbi:hypothetical protein ACFQ51_45375 [Streptomyces kaempferi]